MARSTGMGKFDRKSSVLVKMNGEQGRGGGASSAFKPEEVTSPEERVAEVTKPVAKRRSKRSASAEVEKPMAFESTEG